MKKLPLAFLASATALALAAWLLWTQKLSLLVWALPRLQAVVNPVADNRPVEWQPGPAEAAAPPGERPPNIILILADDMGVNDVSSYTPNIEALAQAGATFTQGYAANAVCAPSRASLLTGRYSTRFGFEFTPFPKVGATIFQWMADESPSPLPLHIDHERIADRPEMAALGMPPQEITLAEALQARGYYTAHIGKWHLGMADGSHPLDQGFDDSLVLRGMLYDREDSPEVVNVKLSHPIERMVWASARYAASFNKSEDFAPEGYLTDYYTRQAVEVIESNRHRPFFLYLAHWAVHNPLQARRDDHEALAAIEDPTLRVYAAMLRALDRSVGALVAALERHGLTDNTLILFTSDNGGAGYLGLADINHPYRGWKLSHFQGGIRVPFMAKWPAQIEAGSRVDAPVHHVDLFHTAAAAASAPLPEGRELDGVDLLPHIQGRAPAPPHQTLFWREGHQQAVLHEGWKLIRAARPNKRWLFNLNEDPTEARNLAASMPQQVARLEALLDAHNAAQAQPLWPSAMDSPQLIDKHHLLPYEEGEEYIYWPN